MCNFQEEKDELLSRATEEAPEAPDTRQEKLQEIIEKERMERKSKLNAYKVGYIALLFKCTLIN